MDLLRVLKSEQGTQSDSQFAARLGVSKALWVRTRMGDMPIRWTIGAAIVARFAHLTPELMVYMRQEATAVRPEYRRRRAS